MPDKGTGVSVKLPHSPMSTLVHLNASTKLNFKITFAVKI